MPRPDEGLIHAWLDGELEATEAARVEQLVATDAEWSAAAAEARGLIAASSRILGALDVVAGDVIPQGGSAAPAMAPTVAGAPPAAPRIAQRIASRRMVPSWMKMAAGIALVAGLGYVARDGIGLTAPKETMPAEETVYLAKANDSAAPAATAATSAAPAVADANPPRRDTGEQEARVREDRPRAELATGAVGAVVRDPVQGPTPAPAAPPATVDVVAPIASTSAVPRAAQTVQNSAQGVAAGASALTGASQAPIDTQARRRALADARLEGVVVTGVTSDAAKQSAERTGVRSIQQPAAKSAAPVSSVAPQAAAARQAESPPPLPIIEGCFRVRTRARIDTLLIDPRILATDADSIRIEIPSARWAWIRRDATGALIGRVWWQRGTANMRADPIDCS